MRPTSENLEISHFALCSPSGGTRFAYSKRPAEPFLPRDTESYQIKSFICKSCQIRICETASLEVGSYRSKPPESVLRSSHPSEQFLKRKIARFPYENEPYFTFAVDKCRYGFLEFPGEGQESTGEFEGYNMILGNFPFVYSNQVLQVTSGETRGISMDSVYLLSPLQNV